MPVAQARKFWVGSLVQVIYKWRSLLVTPVEVSVPPDNPDGLTEVQGKLAPATKGYVSGVTIIVMLVLL